MSFIKLYSYVILETKLEGTVLLLLYGLRKTSLIKASKSRSKLITGKVLAKSHVSSYLCYTLLSGAPWKC